MQSSEQHFIIVIGLTFRLNYRSD